MRAISGVTDAGGSRCFILYNDLSHFCQTGKLKQADYSGYSRELEIIVKNFSSDCDRSKNDNVFIVKDCRITLNDSDYSNFLYMALITLFGRSDFDLDYALKLYNYFILAAIERQDELYDAGYDEYIIDRMCLDHVFNGVVYNIIISNTNKDVDDIHLTISNDLKVNNAIPMLMSKIRPYSTEYDFYGLYDSIIGYTYFLKNKKNYGLRNSGLLRTYIGVDISNGLVKIGKSKDLYTRESCLRVSNIYFYMIAYVDMDIERELHIKYSVYNVDREWFHLNKKQVKEIISKYNFRIIESNVKYIDNIYDI